MNTGKNPFCVAAYRKAFQKILGFSEITNKDECIVDMDEPMGDRIFILPGTHCTTRCKAFVTTTTNDRMLVAVFDLYGKFHRYYELELKDIRNLQIKKVFGGMQISFGADTQDTKLGMVNMQMYIPKHDFGSDLKEQKIHLQRFVKNLKG